MLQLEKGMSFFEFPILSISYKKKGGKGKVYIEFAFPQEEATAIAVANTINATATEYIYDDTFNIIGMILDISPKTKEKVHSIAEKLDCVVSSWPANLD